MQKTDVIWQNGEYVDWDDAQTHVLSHTLHYGGGAFEGIRAYQTDKGPAIFRLAEHIERFFYSMNVLGLKLPYTPQQIIDVCKDIVKRNRLEHGYIRPLAYFGYGGMAVNPKGAAIDIIIACWPWGAYLPHDMVDIKTSQYIRIHPQSTVADAKLCGHYLNSMLATLEVEGTKYHEALFLDLDGNIAEGSGENFFIVKGNDIYTPELGTVLAGITRGTLMELAQQHGYTVHETKITLEDAYAADEAFFTGTAAEVTPIKSIDDKVLGNGELGPVTEKLRSAYEDIVCGRDPNYEHYLTRVTFD